MDELLSSDGMEFAAEDSLILDTVELPVELSVELPDELPEELLPEELPEDILLDVAEGSLETKRTCGYESFAEARACKANNNPFAS
jgi:hypothetical protein